MHSVTRLRVLSFVMIICTIISAGFLIAMIIWLNNTGILKLLIERSTKNIDTASQVELIEPATNSPNELTEDQKNYVTSIYTTNGLDSEPVPDGELWANDTIYIYQTADIDICIGGNLQNVGPTYWQSSNPEVISEFYANARTWLGYASDTCKFPVINGTGKTTITAGTYDSSRRDSVDVVVLEVPEETWKYEVLSLVNKERVKNGLEKLAWGEACAGAANARAREIVDEYSHTRPDDSSWDTACVEPADGGSYVEGENLLAGNAAVSPETVVATWMNSEKHRENILNPNYTKMAVGFYFNSGTNYRTYWSQYFSNF